MDIIYSEEERELLSVKPSIIRFPIPGTIIVKVACGNSYTIALEETQGLVYSWG
jgi:alpha-tubulin suppressor-like RCC1 family protein